MISKLAPRDFGQTDLHVTPICLGCAALGDMPETFAYSVSNEDAYATVRAAFDSPLNFIDTANIYGEGESERRIGVVIRERGGLPPGYVLATKADRHPRTNAFDATQARRSVDESRQRLGLDRLQIVYLHDPEYCDQDEVRGAIDALIGLKSDGIIGHLGLAAGPIDMMLRYLDLADWECVISHNRYTLLDRSAEPLIAECYRRGIAMVNAAPYGSGMLAKGPSIYARYMYRDASRELVAKARAMEQVCESYGVSLAAAALQFSVRDRRIASTVVGMTKPQRIDQTLALAQSPLPTSIWAALDRAAGFVPG